MTEESNSPGNSSAPARDDIFPGRPNVNYNLSKTDTSGKNTEEPVKFYYNREDRLENAPQPVMDLYSEKKTHSRFNLIAPLISDRPKTVLLLSILVLCIAALVLSIFSRTTGSYSLDGNRLEISGIRYEGVTIIVLTKKTTRNIPSPWTGAVDIAVSQPADDNVNFSGETLPDFPVFYHRVYFSLNPEEEYRFAVPFDSPQLLMVLQTDRSNLKIRLKTR